MAESLGIWQSRLLRLRGGLLARLKEIYDRCAVFWPWADKVLILLSFIVMAVRSYGSSPYTFFIDLALTLIFLIIVFRAPLLKPPPPPMSGFIGMVLSYPAMAFLQLPSQFPNYASKYMETVFTAAVLFYTINFVWALYTIRRSFAIFPSVRSLVTRGPYTFVRHPIYSAYLHLAICFTVVVPTLRNIIVTAIFALGLFLRAKCEEGLLDRDQGYGAFRNKVKNRFFNPAYSAPVALLAAVVLFALL